MPTATKASPTCGRAWWWPTTTARWGSSTTGDTQIQAGAALHVKGGRTIAEPLAIREGGIGFGNGTDGSTLGALRSVGGTNTWTGNIDLAGGNNLIGVDGGSTLVVSGVVASDLSNTRRLIKVGDGTLQLAGTSDNVYRGETRVLKGTLELNKSPGKNAIGGDLVIGDHIGGNDAATVRLLASNQIPQVDFFGVAIPTITMLSSGVLDLNGNSDVIGNLTMFTGTTYSADVMTGAGTLTLGGNLTLSNFQGSSGVIAGGHDFRQARPGRVLLRGRRREAASGGTRTFTISDTQLNNIATDLDISAVISGTSDVSISKTSGGTLRLSGANTFSGPFIMNGGIIEIGNNCGVRHELAVAAERRQRAQGRRRVADDRQHDLAGRRRELPGRREHGRGREPDLHRQRDADRRPHAVHHGPDAERHLRGRDRRRHLRQPEPQQVRPRHDDVHGRQHVQRLDDRQLGQRDAGAERQRLAAESERPHRGRSAAPWRWTTPGPCWPTA